MWSGKLQNNLSCIHTISDKFNITNKNVVIMIHVYHPSFWKTKSHTGHEMEVWLVYIEFLDLMSTSGLTIFASWAKWCACMAPPGRVLAGSWVGETGSDNWYKNYLWFMFHSVETGPLAKAQRGNKLEKVCPKPNQRKSSEARCLKRSSLNKIF